jgi:hypothetical protein
MGVLLFIFIVRINNRFQAGTLGVTKLGRFPDAGSSGRDEP